jgi:uroporphyrinogen decarboxylase
MVAFLPALYDIKASLAKEEGYLFPVSSESLLTALRLEVEELGLSTLTAAYDIYNIEAEAIGSALRRDPSIGMPEIENPLINSLDEIKNLPILTQPAGRMSLFVNAAAKAKVLYGDTHDVRGAVSGPFSMASKIFPREELLIETIMNPEGVKLLLAYCNQCIKLYANEFLKKGCDVVVFDSFVAPPMLSPETYRDIVLPFHKELFSFIEKNGGKKLPLIAGGDTRPLLPYLIESGATQLILDYVIPAEKALECMINYPNIIFRYNIDPALVIQGSDESIEIRVKTLVNLFKKRQNWILGTGILPNGINVNKIKLISKILQDMC